MTTTMTTEKKVHQSKWGYHPISREASKKLRFINRVYAAAQHVAGAWERWDRKQPQNRILRRTLKDETGKKYREIVKDASGKPVPWPEPEVCPLFHTTSPGYTESYGSIVWGRAKDNGYGQEIIEASRQARTPQPTPEDVKPFPFTEEEIDGLYETAKEWLESRASR